MADGISETLSKDIGPLPVWGWGVAIAGGLGVGYLVRRQMGGSLSGGDSGEEEPPPEEGRQSGPLGATQGPVRLPGAPGGQGSTTSRPRAATNPEWKRRAVQWASEAGFGSLETDIALARYLGGQVLTQEQATIVDSVLSHFGTPPEGAPSAQVRPPGEGQDETTDPPDPEDPKDPVDPRPGRPHDPDYNLPPGYNLFKRLLAQLGRPPTLREFVGAGGKSAHFSDLQDHFGVMQPSRTGES